MCFSAAHSFILVDFRHDLHPEEEFVNKKRRQKDSEDVVYETVVEWLNATRQTRPTEQEIIDYLETVDELIGTAYPEESDSESESDGEEEDIDADDEEHDASNSDEY
jgi:hypothetical protein